MKVIDAIWEKRNLGIDVVEVEVQNGDLIEEVALELPQIQSDYICVKIPSDMNEIAEYVQQMGYRFREDQIHMRHDLKPPSRNALQQRLYNAISYQVMNDEDIVELKEEIRKGMFSSDRFSIDKCFTEEQCSNRYINWVDDLLKDGATPYVMSYKGEHSGFIILKTTDERIYQSVLGGAYSKYRKSGLGVIQKEQEITKKMNGKYVETMVSSNNVSQLKALILNGYIPIEINHVFVKNRNVID